MKEQLTRKERLKLAKELFLLSLIKEDRDLRADARTMGVLDELLEYRDLAIQFTEQQD